MRADLTRADLSDANLNGADLTDATLPDANLFGEGGMKKGRGNRCENPQTLCYVTITSYPR
jgi:uncharacterized protein YjbI with pentapeptide repeats